MLGSKGIQSRKKSVLPGERRIGKFLGKSGFLDAKHSFFS
jgi:hypothetical protein